jgi:hypothetical protein
MHVNAGGADGEQAGGGAASKQLFISAREEADLEELLGRCIACVACVERRDGGEDG